VAGIGYFLSPQARTRFEAVYAEALRVGPPLRERLDVPTTYGQVRVHRHGPDGPAPIVLLHGRNATMAMWAPNIPGLAAPRIPASLSGLPTAWTAVTSPSRTCRTRPATGVPGEVTTIPGPPLNSHGS
jgi:pimeloyl-ACP methyl ester carboxylesterase